MYKIIRTNNEFRVYYAGKMSSPFHHKVDAVQYGRSLLKNFSKTSPHSSKDSPTKDSDINNTNNEVPETTSCED